MSEPPLDPPAGRRLPARDAVIVNAAAALVAYDGLPAPVTAEDLTKALAAGIERAANSIDSGAAKAKLTDWVAATRA